MIKDKVIALIAHDRRKSDMAKWAYWNAKVLLDNKIVCTGTTGNVVEDQLFCYIGENLCDLSNIAPDVTKVHSGPMGGDAEIAALVVQKKIDMCIFLIDDMNANPHEADIQMLLRQCRVHNIPVACNLQTADLMMTSSIWNDKDYTPSQPTYIHYERSDNELN